MWIKEHVEEDNPILLARSNSTVLCCGRCFSHHFRGQDELVVVYCSELQVYPTHGCSACSGGTGVHFRGKAESNLPDLGRINMELASVLSWGYTRLSK